MCLRLTFLNIPWFCLLLPIFTIFQQDCCNCYFTSYPLPLPILRIKTHSTCDLWDPAWSSPCPPQLYLIIDCQTLDHLYCLLNWMEPHLTCSLSLLSPLCRLCSSNLSPTIPSPGLRPISCLAVLSPHCTYLTSAHSWVLSVNVISSNNFPDSSSHNFPCLWHVALLTIGNYIPHEVTVHGCIANHCTLITVLGTYVLGKYLLNEHLSVSSQLGLLFT